MADVSPGGPPDPDAPAPAAHASAAASSSRAAAPLSSSSPRRSARADAAGVVADAGAFVADAAGAGVRLVARRRRCRNRRPVAAAPAGGAGCRSPAVIVFLLAGAIGMLLFLGVDYRPAGAGGRPDRRGHPGPAAGRQLPLARPLRARAGPLPGLLLRLGRGDRHRGRAVRQHRSRPGSSTGSGLPDALVAVLVAPFIEESMKALGPILLFWRRRERVVRHHRRHRLLRAFGARLRHGGERPLPGRTRLRGGRRAVRPGDRPAERLRRSSSCASCSPASRTRSSPR